MSLVFREAWNWKWWKPLYYVETYDKVHDEYVIYRDMSWLEMVFIVRYYKKRGWQIEEGQPLTASQLGLTA